MSEAESEEVLEIENQDDLALVKRMQEGREKIVAEIKKIIIGQEEIIDELLIALFGGGHVLVTGVPGLAKTLLIKTVADILQVDFSRIQFTPDLMPADVVGSEVIDESDGTRKLKFVKGPIFTNILLADEINTPQDPVIPVRGHGRTASDSGRRDPCYGRALLRVSDPKSHRTGRYLSLAGSAVG